MKEVEGGTFLDLIGSTKNSLHGTIFRALSMGKGQITRSVVNVSRNEDKQFYSHYHQSHFEVDNSVGFKFVKQTSYT